MKLSFARLRIYRSARRQPVRVRTSDFTAATNDIGIIYLPNGKHLAIAVFVSDSEADEKTREAVIAKIAKAAWDRWNRKN